MTDIDDRLRSGLTALADRVQPAATPDDVIVHLDQPRGRSKAIALRAAVAAAVVLVVVTTILLLRDGDDHAVVDVGPSPTTTAPRPEWHPTGLAPGWHGLPAGPLGALYPRAMVWTGSELIIWRGEGGLPEKMASAASFAPASGEWTELPPDPLDVPYLSGRGAGGAWTGAEALFWAAEGMVAWDPSSASWRNPASPPHPHERDGVWTGNEVVFWADGLAYDPYADSWREIARPSAPLVASVNDDAEGTLFLDGQVVVVGGLSGAYDPATDSWREFGAPLAQEAGSPGVAWDGFTATAVEIDGRVAAFDWSPDSAAALDLASGVWNEVPEWTPAVDVSGELRVVPFDDGRLLFVGVETASQLRAPDGTWAPVSQPPSNGALLGTGEVVFSYGNAAPSFTMFVPPVTETAAGVGWDEFDRGPLPVDRSPQAAAYDYRRDALYVFGLRGSDEITANVGYELDLRTQEWSEIPSAPLDTLDGLDGIFDGESFVVWSQAGAAFWDPENEQWRAGSPPPRSLRRAPWVPGNPAPAAPDLIWWADGLAYDMQTDQWREIARPPSVPTRASAVYDADELFVVGLANEQAPTVTAQYAYSVSDDSWRELPPPGLNGQALDLLWLGQDRRVSILGVDYLGNAAAYDTSTNEWRPIDRIPIDFGEGRVRLARIGQGAFLSSTWGFAVLDVEERGREVVGLRWRTVDSDFPPGGLPVTSGAAVFVVGERIARFTL